MQSAQKSRIAFCLEYPILAFGGTEVLVAELIRGLASHIEITLVSSDKSLAGTWVEDLVKAHIQWDSGNPERFTPEQLTGQLVDAGIQLAHFHFGSNYAWRNRRVNATPLLHLRKRGIRCITTNHGFFSPLENYCAYYRPLWLKLALFPAAWISKIQTLRAVECEIAVSQYDLRELQFWYWPLRKRFRQIYHSQLHPEQMTLGNSEERKKRILCVGTFGSRKGQPVLADAFIRVANRHPEWQLVFAGRLGEVHWWEQIQADVLHHGLQSRVHRYEGLSHEEIMQLMRSSEIFVMPSLYEGLGLSLQEALFHGCACIATRCGGPEDFIEPEQNGFLVPKGDPAALAETLDRLMLDTSLRERLRSRAPASILERKMTAQAMVQAYQDLYRELL
ncbi:MAG: glycosyltransferase family 1 protein [Verrucomicrobiaceae bacterium]|nr:MAG: glycosyltransferase family 1 protein [Verrucomicrobiaceae bacterium]